MPDDPTPLDPEKIRAAYDDLRNRVVKMEASHAEVDAALDYTRKLNRKLDSEIRQIRDSMTRVLGVEVDIGRFGNAAGGLWETSGRIVADIVEIKDRLRTLEGAPRPESS